MLPTRQTVATYLMQAVVIGAALALAWLLRFDFVLPPLRLLFWFSSLLVVIRLLAMHCCQLNQSHWRYTSIADVRDLGNSVLLGSAAFFLVVRLVGGIHEFPDAVYVLEGVFSFLLLTGLRIGARLVLQEREAHRVGESVPVLIVGAGSGAVLLLQALKRKNYRAVGLVDDDPEKRNTKLCGIPVVGCTDQLPNLARHCGAREILVAIPSATGSQMLRIADLCGRAGLPFRAVPDLADLLDGTVAISELRPVNLDDLLGRDPVRLDTENVRAKLTGQVVMVTGAAGSIGSELCKQIARYMPKKLICVDQAETPLFNLQQRGLITGDVTAIYSVANIADTERMRRLMLEHGVQVIFHAAAYKHVPLTEANPYEGVKNNVFGLLDLVHAAEECGCSDFLLISSDKAVEPTSLMGCTKRLGELIVGSRPITGMRCVSVRFGNVLGSQGSVVPLFQEQIRTRGCVTVTHPQMTRYFMTIPEAVSLVLQAFTVGEHGNVLVLDMGDPIRIVDLAKTLIRMSGKDEKSIPIVFTGMRPGEKLFEELFYASEIRLPTPLSKVLRAQSPIPARPIFERYMQELRMAAESHDADLIRAKIKQIIPEYQWVPALVPKLDPVSTLRVFPAVLRAAANS